MTTTLNPHHDDLMQTLALHHRSTDDLVEVATHGLPVGEWPACAHRLLVELARRGVKTEAAR